MINEIYDYLIITLTIIVILFTIAHIESIILQKKLKKLENIHDNKDNNIEVFYPRYIANIP